MRLLILTQKVDKNDDVLGFFHSWIVEFSKRCEVVTVICLEKGEYNLSHNVSILSLGKEKLKIFKRPIYIVRFIRYIARIRHDYDTVFVHMNPEYVVLGGLLWRLWRKKIGLWYVHRQINLKLRIAEKLAHIIFSTTPEAFRLKSKKIHFLGHGVDFSLFPHNKLSTSDVHSFKILHVGRITPIKNLDILIETAAILKKTWNKKFKIVLAGVPSASGDEEYEKKLKELVETHDLKNEISFIGKMPFMRVAELYKEADITVNLTPTGGMDKAVLESIASGTIAFSANRALTDLFGEYADHLLYNERDAEDTANKIMGIMDMESSKKQRIEDYLYERVRARFNLDSLIKRIVEELKTHERI
ncbi:MAG: glycosyltransferase family 4 protein [bacterium]|nr:glycosyltransferase family 4 protein [bacterium]